MKNCFFILRFCSLLFPNKYLRFWKNAKIIVVQCKVRLEITFHKQWYQDFKFMNIIIIFKVFCNLCTLGELQSVEWHVWYCRLQFENLSFHLSCVWRSLPWIHGARPARGDGQEPPGRHSPQGLPRAGALRQYPGNTYSRRPRKSPNLWLSHQVLN